MPKKIIYDQKARDELFWEHMKELHPDRDDIIDLAKYLTPEERANMFLDICNKYGEKGWVINPLPYQSGDLWYYLMYKESYTKD